MFTRGVLIDVAALKGVETLPDTYEITVQDLEDALKKQNTTLQPGDAILINTGWHKLWAKDNARFVKSCPGIGIKAAEWLIAKEPILLGSDNWPVEVSPEPRPAAVAAGASGRARRPRRAPAREPETAELAQKQVYEFAFVMQPLKIQGGSGSTVAPIAVR